MSITKPHKISTLPMWAQDRIKVLERDLAAAKEKNRLQDAGDTEVFMKNYTFAPHLKQSNIALPPDTAIVFELGEGCSIEAQVEDMGEHKGLAVTGVGNRHSLLFHPLASNHAILFNHDLRYP